VHIRQLQLQSYGPFENSGPIEFRRGINLIVGQNNSGKSALLRSLRSDWPNWPHRNLQRYRAHDLLPSQQFIRLAATGDELRRALLSFGNAAQYWPIPTQPDDLSSEKFAEEYLLPAKEYDFDFVRQQATGASKPDAERPTHNLFDVVRYHLQITATPPTITVNGWNQGNQDSGPNIANAIFNQNLFRFDAERLNVGRSAQQDVDDLAPNAANLPAVLQTMRGRRPRLFDQLVARVREILPSIYSFTPASVGTSETEILVWPTESMDNPEHGFALNESGTGVAQVIAILTAVLTRTDAVIVIDEINSFLHPAAAKALIRILKAEHGDHQYIISTHSAEVI
jgi:hypothetical protein